MEYKGITTCSFCNKPFEFKYLPRIRAKISSAKLAEVVDLGGNIAHLDYFDNGIPYFTVRCPYCNKDYQLSQDEASMIPWETSES